MKKITFLCLSLFFLLATSCTKKEDNELKAYEDTADEIEITDYFAAGIIGESDGVYLVQFLEKNKAVFYNNQDVLRGSYKIENNILTAVFNVSGYERKIHFHWNADKQIRFSYYEEQDTPIFATGKLIKISETNQFTGKTFQGQEFRQSRKLLKEKYFYKFNDDGKTFGVGETSEGITFDRNYQLLNSSVYRYVKGRVYEIGFVDGETLHIYGTRPAIYSGTYNQVK